MKKRLKILQNGVSQSCNVFSFYDLGEGLKKCLLQRKTSILTTLT